mmetsp:Transcript_63076/g.150332  ORF Transcript_63076/g.150332 Transcript_63076/m.150332 type:complete len:256 (+) Transcript_63076:85-852(+)
MLAAIYHNHISSSCAPLVCLWQLALPELNVASVPSRLEPEPASNHVRGSVELVASLFQEFQQRLLSRLPVGPFLGDLGSHLADGVLHHAEKGLLCVLASFLLCKDRLLQAGDLIRSSSDNAILHGFATLRLLAKALVELRDIDVHVPTQRGLGLHARLAFPRDLLAEHRSLLLEAAQDLRLRVAASLLFSLQRLLEPKINGRQLLRLGVLQSLSPKALLVEVLLELCQLLLQVAAFRLHILLGDLKTGVDIPHLV